MSKRTRSWNWTLLGLGLILLLLAPVLSPSRTLIYRDCLPYTAPLNHLLRGALSEGRLPEWDPSAFGGVPFLANPSSQALYPPRWVAVLLTRSPTQASDLYALLHLALALLGAAAFGRELGLERGPRRLVAITYALGGPLLSLLGNLVYLAGAAWVPLSLAWILRARRKATNGGWPFARALGLAAAGVTAPFYAGDPQTTGWLALLAVVVLLAPSGGASSPIARRTLGLIGLGAATLLLALALLLPAALLTAQTTRGVMPYTIIGLWSFHPARLSELLLAYPLGLPFPEARFSVAGGLEPQVRDLWTHTLFLGAGALLFVLRGLGPLPAALKRARLGLLVLGGVALVLAFGRHTPVHPWICEHTPYSIFRYPEKHLTLVSLALAGLAGVGLQAWLASEPWRDPKRLLPCALLPLLTFLLVWPLSEWSTELAGLELWRVPRTPPELEGQALATALVQLWLLGLLALPRLRAARRAAGVVLAVGLTSLSSMRPLVFDGPTDLAEATPVTVEALRRLAPPRPMGQKVIRLPTVSMFGGYPAIEGLRGAEAAALMHPLTLGSATCALFDLEGLHGLTGFYPLRLTQLKLATSWPVLMQRSAVGHELGPLTPERLGETLFDEGLGIGIYPVAARPRLELLSGVHWVPDEEAGWAALAEVSTAAVVAVGPGAAAPEARAAGRVWPSEAMGARNLGYVSLETSAPGPALLVVRDAYFPGWEARVDGVSAPVVHVDGAFMGVEVPAGEHLVELRYRTPGFRLGLAISLPAWLGLALLLAGGARRARGRDPSAS